MTQYAELVTFKNPHAFYCYKVVRYIAKDNVLVSEYDPDKRTVLDPAAYYDLDDSGKVYTYTPKAEIRSTSGPGFFAYMSNPFGFYGATKILVRSLSEHISHGGVERVVLLCIVPVAARATLGAITSFKRSDDPNEPGLVQVLTDTIIPTTEVWIVGR